MDLGPHAEELTGAVFGASYSGEQTWDISCDTGNGFLSVILFFERERRSHIPWAGLKTHIKDDLELLLLLSPTS